MTKEDLLEDLEYCMGDTQIFVRIYGKYYPIEQVQHVTVKGVSRFVLITDQGP